MRSPVPLVVVSLLACWSAQGARLQSQAKARVRTSSSSQARALSELTSGKGDDRKAEDETEDVITRVAAPVATPIAAPVPAPVATPVATPVAAPVAAPVPAPVAPDACDTSCPVDEVRLENYSQWSHEDGYWLGNYTYMDENGDPLYDPEFWNYPYAQYKGFITGSVEGGSYSQRNVFMYPPQTAERCAADNRTMFEGDVCGQNGGMKKFEADQTTTVCDTTRPGAISGPYQGKKTTTELVGAGNALLYQVFDAIDGVETLEHSQLTTITTLADGTIHRTRTAQLFDPVSGGVSGAPYRCSFYRERRVSKEDFYAALDAQIAAYGVTDAAVQKICYGATGEEALANLKAFLEGGRTWPREAKFACPSAPITNTRTLRWTPAGAGQYPDTFGRATVAGERVTDADIAAAAGVGAGLSADALVGFGWWEDASLVWLEGGAGQYPDTFGRTTVADELVTEGDVQAAAGVGAGLSVDALIAYGWWGLKDPLVWAAAGASKYPDTFGRVTVAGERVTDADIAAAAGVGAGLSVPALVAYGWWSFGGGGGGGGGAVNATSTS